jgi:hypothetical protein
MIERKPELISLRESHFNPIKQKVKDSLLCEYVPKITLELDSLIKYLEIELDDGLLELNDAKIIATKLQKFIDSAIQLNSRKKRLLENDIVNNLKSALIFTRHSRRSGNYAKVCTGTGAFLTMFITAISLLYANAGITHATIPFILVLGIAFLMGGIGASVWSMDTASKQAQQKFKKISNSVDHFFREMKPQEDAKLLGSNYRQLADKIFNLYHPYLLEREIFNDIQHCYRNKAIIKRHIDDGSFIRHLLDMYVIHNIHNIDENHTLRDILQGEVVLREEKISKRQLIEPKLEEIVKKVKNPAPLVSVLPRLGLLPTRSTFQHIIVIGDAKENSDSHEIDDPTTLGYAPLPGF